MDRQWVNILFKSFASMIMNETGLEFSFLNIVLVRLLYQGYARHRMSWEEQTLLLSGSMEQFFIYCLAESTGKSISV